MVIEEDMIKRVKYGDRETEAEFTEACWDDRLDESTLLPTGCPNKGGKAES